MYCRNDFSLNICSSAELLCRIYVKCYFHIWKMNRNLLTGSIIAKNIEIIVQNDDKWNKTVSTNEKCIESSEMWGNEFSIAAEDFLSCPAALSISRGTGTDLMGIRRLALALAKRRRAEPLAVVPFTNVLFAAVDFMTMNALVARVACQAFIFVYRIRPDARSFTKRCRTEPFAETILFGVCWIFVHLIFFCRDRDASASHNSYGHSRGNEKGSEHFEE